MNDRHTTTASQVDELVDVLSAANRRTVLEYLRDTKSETVSLDELARELDGPRPVDETRLRLHHATLPRLADAGVLAYDPRGQTVAYQGSEALEALLEEPRQLDDRRE